MEPYVLREEKEADRPSSLFILQSWCGTDGLTAGFTTRHAGNVALHVGDEPDHVVSNREAVTGLLGWEFAAFTCAEQVHGSDVRVVAAKDAGRGRASRETAFADTDAMITNEPDVLLAMFYADCVPLYFYDPVTGSLGLAHAGWKGTVAEIAVKTVEKMREVYGALPENMRAAIGPSIGGCCYEVDESVLRHVRPLANLSTEEVVKPNEFGDRAQLNLKHLNRQLMIKAGIMPSRIEMSSWCTSCRTDLLFSHRKERGATGRMMSWLGKKSR
ncbi:peptidoglycan editing factor PgeF [Cohnella cellulosilytica]|uniref:Purine nucleoside phosphorylase n=1 Tax=Cohnella cellulosilytica TaxID=986710 RepID=A0ABW2F7H0_9BACL